ncbi:MAG: hypothetical protein IPP80_12875 [Ignavibacteria bacterium]|nr:hypothetical protein [Ignavibacteria bacterium]
METVEQQKEVFSMIQNESTVISVLKEQEQIIYFDADSPLVLIRVSYGNDRLATFVEKKSLIRDVPPPEIDSSISEHAKGIVNVWFRRTRQALSEYVPNHDRLSRYRIYIDGTSIDIGLVSVYLVDFASGEETRIGIVIRVVDITSVMELFEYIGRHYYSKFGTPMELQTIDLPTA